MTHPDYHDARADYEHAWEQWSSRALFRRAGFLVLAMIGFVFLSDAFRLLPVGVTIVLNFVPLTLFVIFCRTKRLRREFENTHALDDYVRLREVE